MSTVMEYLQERGVPFLVLPHPDAETVLDTARRHGFHTDEVVKTVVVTTRYGNALLVLRYDREAVEELVVGAFGDEEVVMTGERELLRNYPDHEPGSIPPLGRFFQARCTSTPTSRAATQSCSRPAGPRSRSAC